MADVEAMSEGTTNQLLLSLRLAALEQSVAAGIPVSLRCVCWSSLARELTRRFFYQE